MANPFYNYSGAFIAGTLARAEAESAEFNSVAAGFSLLSTQGIDTGSGNAYVVTTQGAPTVAYADGNNVSFKAATGNTGPATIAVNSIPAVALFRANGTALQAGDIVAGTWYTAVFNSTYGGFTFTSPAVVAVIPGTISAAPPTNKVGLVAAGGVATSAVPIDATFAIDQGIAPTWIGIHTFSAKPVMNAGLTVTGAAITSSAGLTVSTGSVALQSGAAVSGSALTASAGLTVSAGAVALQSGAAVSGSALTASAGLTVSAGSVIVGAPTGAGQGTGTVNATGLFINGVAVTAGTGAGGVSSITGTANQIAASASTGSVTLSLPQNVIIPTPAAGTALTVNQGTGAVPGILAVGAGNMIAIQGDLGVLNIRNTANTNVSQLGTVKGWTSSGSVTDTALGAIGALNLYAGGAVTPALGIDTSGRTTLATPTVTAGGFGNYTLNVSAPTTASGSFGIYLRAGTNASDRPFLVNNAADSVSYVQLMGDGSFMLGSPTGGAQGLGTLNATGLFVNGVAVSVPISGSFTGTLTGMTAGTTGTVNYSISGKIVTLWVAATISGTSNSTAMTMTGLPAAVQTSVNAVSPSATQVLNNGVSQLGVATPLGSSITFSLMQASGVTIVSTAFNNTGVKGLSGGFVITYPLS